MNKVWINQSKRRYYRVILQNDLLGDLVIIRSWGSLDSDRGQVRKEIVDSESDGIMKVQEIEKRRLYRGYTNIRSRAI
jgi:hypothetical protein